MMWILVILSTSVLFIVTALNGINHISNGTWVWWMHKTDYAVRDIHDNKTAGQCHRYDIYYLIYVAIWLYLIIGRFI